MNFTQFYELFLQKVVFHCTRPNATRYANTENTRLDRGFMANNVYNAKFNVQPCLEHAYPIEGTYFQ